MPAKENLFNKNFVAKQMKFFDFLEFFLVGEPEQPIEEDDTELLVPVAAPVAGPTISNAYSMRNTDKELYFRSGKAKTCPLCHWRRNKSMVCHFNTHHPNEEVFVSRISPKMVDYIAPQNEHERTFVKFMSHKREHLQTMCIFCEETRSFPAYYWNAHMSGMHTGEYAYMCDVCDKPCGYAQHCNVTARKVDTFDLRLEHMIAYRCNECNFVQRKIENIRAHLANQHGLYDEGEENFQVFTLLPAFRSLVRQNDPNELQQIQGK